MSTTRISQLPELPSISANTSNTMFLGVDMPTGTTGKFTATTLAQQLYANNALAVGNNLIIFSNTIAQFSGYDESFLQVNMQNFQSNGSGDFVVTGDKGTNSNNYINLGLNGSEFEDVEATALLANDGYLYVHGTGVTNQGNLIIGAVSTGTETRFIAGGSNTEHIVAKISESGLTFENGQGIIFEDGTTLSSNSEFITTTILSSANTWLQANDLTTLTVAEGYTDTANTKMKSYVDVANTSLKSYSDSKFLANTTGTFGGNLFITGNANVGSQMIVANSTYDYTNTALVRIVGSGGVVQQTTSNPGYMLDIVGIDGVASRVINTGYGTGAYGLYAGRHANGTAASPTPTANNDVIARFSGGGYNGSTFTAIGQGRIDIVADEDFTTANNGSRIEFYNTIPGSNTLAKIATFNATTVTFSGAVKPENGFIWKPRIEPDTNSTLTINFEDDSLIKAGLSGPFEIQFTNYTAGKVVEVWLVNTSGLGRTVTHGCSSTNSTTNSTTFYMPSTSSAHLKYFSIDGDLANTFVSITQG